VSDDVLLPMVRDFYDIYSQHFGADSTNASSARASMSPVSRTIAGPNRTRRTIEVVVFAMADPRLLCSRQQDTHIDVAKPQLIAVAE